MPRLHSLFVSHGAPTFATERVGTVTPDCQTFAALAASGGPTQPLAGRSPMGDFASSRTGLRTPCSA